MAIILISKLSSAMIVIKLNFFTQRVLNFLGKFTWALDLLFRQKGPLLSLVTNFVLTIIYFLNKKHIY
jgi:hypothetical protein